MKLLLTLGCLVLVALCADGLKSTPRPAKSCPKCDAADYEPVCVRMGGTDKEPKLTTFGSACVLKSYNCEKNSHLVAEKKGECPPGSPVRLS